MLDTINVFVANAALCVKNGLSAFQFLSTWFLDKMVNVGFFACCQGNLHSFLRWQITSDWWLSRNLFPPCINLDACLVSGSLPGVSHRDSHLQWAIAVQSFDFTLGWQDVGPQLLFRGIAGQINRIFSRCRCVPGDLIGTCNQQRLVDRDADEHGGENKFDYMRYLQATKKSILPVFAIIMSFAAIYFPGGWISAHGLYAFFNEGDFLIGIIYWIVGLAGEAAAIVAHLFAWRWLARIHDPKS